MLRLGMLAGDSGHTVEFTRRLNQVGIPDEQWVGGARVVAAAQVGSRIDPDRIPGYVEQIRQCGVEIVPRVEDLIGLVDAVLVETQDGGDHLEQAMPFIQAGVPLFVDKPLATSTTDARQIVEAARARGIAFGSSSALRYSLEVQDVHRRRDELGPVVGADAYSVAVLHPRNPGLFHYGVHAVETLYGLMGVGCQSVRCVWDETPITHHPRMARDCSDPGRFCHSSIGFPSGSRTEQFKTPSAPRLGRASLTSPRARHCASVASMSSTQTPRCW
jgi:predicted dehydrogenase